MSELPSSFWTYDYYMVKDFLATDIEKVAQKFPKDNKTKSYKNLQQLISVMKNESLDEAKLACGLNDLSQIFVISKIENEKLEKFKTLSQKFLQRAEFFEGYQKTRAIYTKKTPEEQRKHDQELFNNVAIINYCLEYYLSIYKALTNLKTEKEKLNFLNSKKVDFGFGELIGLKEDLAIDESLTKLILNILDDKVRTELLNEYYILKNATRAVTNANRIENALKSYISTLLKYFDQFGVEYLSQ